MVAVKPGCLWLRILKNYEQEKLTSTYRLRLIIIMMMMTSTNSNPASR